jgi:predicted ester cyclase
MPFGPEAMKGTVRMVTAAFPDNHHEVEEIISGGDRVVMRCTLTGTHEGPFMGVPPTGRRIEVTEIHIYHLEDGKAVEHRVGRDDLGAMRQLGVVADAVPEPGSAPHATAANAPE